MNDLAPHQVIALEDASKMAGEYLTELGKTDLAIMTRDEWNILLTVIVCRYRESENKNAPCPF